jgi:hypothetical protein
VYSSPTPPQQTPIHKRVGFNIDEHMELQSAIAIIQDLVFEVQCDLANLLFRYELWERREERLEALISTLLHPTPTPWIMAPAMAPAKNA